VGISDVVTKSIGSANPYNMVRATFDGLKVQTSPRMIAARRGKKVSELVGRRAGHAQETAETEDVA
ncbi:MAG: 30S ribosomal protein S5, partial [Rhodospirillales bacterium]|nr:30S ribosomal protein S5 [Rhodospirillales bacterium]